ncbi:MAG TPA: putative LPS assembly protein LptD, partial [Gemmatimonadaceae bacterium]
GRSEVTRDFPNFSITTPTLSLGERFDWTPSLRVSNREQLKVPRNGEFAYRYNTVGATLDSTRLNSNSRSTTLDFGTPFKIFGFSIPLNLTVADAENNTPVRIQVVDSLNPEVRNDRIFAKTFRTTVDWSTGFSLPQLLPTTLKLAPQVSIENVGGGPYWIRTEQSGGKYVHTSKRLSYGATMSPTIYGLFPGVGPVERLRHTITTSVNYRYAPATEVSREYLRATNTNPIGYLGDLAANNVTLSLSQVLEAKLKPKDSVTEGKKVKLLGVNFTPLSYDFERKKKTGQGFTTDDFGMSFNSDLLPGFTADMHWSLFQGSVLSDTSKFKPFRTSINASFSVNGNSGIFGALTRLLGRAVPTSNPQVERLNAGPTDALENRVASTPIAGVTGRNRQYNLPQTQGWQASFVFSSTRQRPPVGDGQVVTVDPLEYCQQFQTGPQANPFNYQTCVDQQSVNPVGPDPIGSLTPGGPFIRIPARETLGMNTAFHITPKWSATWGTLYDFQSQGFASHSVTLQRELHDWRAIFAFTRAPNGNFAFNFFIALNAQPDLKFQFDRQTYRQSGQ